MLNPFEEPFQSYAAWSVSRFSLIVAGKQPVASDKKSDVKFWRMGRQQGVLAGFSVSLMSVIS